MFTEPQRRLWEAYQSAEARAPRPEKLLALEAFLDSLALSPPETWFGWARSLAEDVVDRGTDFVIRRPLFERALFPALSAGYKAQLPGSARWLAGLSKHLSRCPACRAELPTEEATELGLLLAAIKHDPEDRESRLRLIGAIADRLRYSLHEVPAGVLYGIDGASPEQCQELETELDEFCRLVALEQMEQRHAELIGECRYHFRAYKDYLLNRERYSSYAEYLLQDRTTRS